MKNMSKLNTAEKQQMFIQTESKDKFYI